MSTVVATSSNYHAHAPTSSKSNIDTTTNYDLKACLEILKRLSPIITPDLPTLSSYATTYSNSLSLSNVNVTQARNSSSTSKRKLEEGNDHKLDTTSKRQRKSTSPVDNDNDYSKKHDKAKKIEKPLSTSKTSDVNIPDTTNANVLIPHPTIRGVHRRTGSTSTSITSLKGVKDGNRTKTATDEEDLSSSTTTTKKTKKKSSPPAHSSLSIVATDPSAATAAGSPSLPSSAAATSSSTTTTHFTSSSTARSTNITHATTITGSPELNNKNSISLTSDENGNPRWTRDRFKKIAAICREKGRELKHSGDKRMREYSSAPSSSSSSSSSHSRSSTSASASSVAGAAAYATAGTAATAANANASSVNAATSRHLIPILALLEQVDAVILYAYAFWCEDQAAGSMRTRQVSSASLSSSTSSNHSATTGANVVNTPQLGGPASNSAAAPATTTTTVDDNTATHTTAAAADGHHTTTSASAAAIPSSSSSATAILSSQAQATGSSWKPGCITENWKSIFGLVGFVRSRAERLISHPPTPTSPTSRHESLRVREQLPRIMEIIVAWMNMLEALILQHLTTNSSRHLNAQASRLLGTISSTNGHGSANGCSPAANGLSPPGNDNESTISSSSCSNSSHHHNTAPETSNFLQSFLKLQGDLERIHTLWPASQDILLHPENSQLPSASASYSGTSSRRNEEDLLNLVLRKGRMAYDYEPTKLDDIVMPNLPRDGEADSFDGTTNVTAAADENTNHNRGSAGPQSPEDLFKDEENYFRFSWPVIMHHRNAVAHTASFGRALVFEAAIRLGVDYTPPNIEPR